MAPTVHDRRRARAWRFAGLGGLATALVAGTFAMVVPSASAATLFTADFENGSTSGWSKSGGTWSIVTDGSQALDQSSATTDRAREFAGSTSWTNYSVQASVKATSFGSGGVVALASRVSSATKMYRLALTGSNQVQLQSMDGSTVSVLASRSQTVSTNTWYTLRIDASGGTISGYINGTRVGTVSNSDYGSGQIGLFTAFAGGRFDNVSVTDSSTTPPPTTAPPTSR
ncbi:MAG TPA: family 16 glycoside hydrolase, partial [Rugosimonospora sp.]